MTPLKPSPDNTTAFPFRQVEARRRRDSASEIATLRSAQLSANNGEIDAFDTKPTSFHKGLPHDRFGIPDSDAFEDLVVALNRDDFFDGQHVTFDVALGPDPASSVSGFLSVTADGTPKVRNWESPMGGHAYALQGPDAGDVAMAPAPTLQGSELVAEMAEVYALALLRDTPFSEIEAGGNTLVRRYTDEFTHESAGFSVAELVAELAALPFLNSSQSIAPGYGPSVTAQETRRREARLKQGESAVSKESIFRGSVPGAKDGPYLSQFILIGSGNPGSNSAAALGAALAASPAQSYNAEKSSLNIAPPSSSVGFEAATGALSVGDVPDDDEVSKGYITYGAQRIDQRVGAHRPGRDHMTDWTLWLDAQNGADLRGADSYFSDGTPRFIATPRDLATYVHFDQLYQAYLNTCLLLFSYKMPLDFGFPSGRSHKTRGSFAVFGEPHLLSLLTEVASRGLKAVRRQKFQQHLRGRPEQLAAMVTLSASTHANALGTAEGAVATYRDALLTGAPNLMRWIDAHNSFMNGKRAGDADFFPKRNGDHGFEPESLKNYLLPMAFPEGSPMHAAYGAGHATVAGACTTVLKAFFELSTGRPTPDGSATLDQPLTPQHAMKHEKWWDPVKLSALGLKRTYRAPDDRNAQRLVNAGVDPDSLTVEGELNKLAANIAIGRNMAGVHFYTDYYDSLRMGERVAVGILQEQMTSYVEPVSMRLHSFDGDPMVIYGDGNGRGFVKVKQNGVWIDAYDEWWDRHIVEFEPDPSIA